MKLNAAWHKKNKMPKNPSNNERIEWHLEHIRHCTCRPMSEKLKEEVKKYNLKRKT
jgi:hypothetical protein